MHNNSHGELCQFQTLLTLPSTWLIDTLIAPITGQGGGRRKHPSCTCIVCNVSKEALSDAGLGGQFTNPKCSPLTGVQYVSVHCVLILVLGYVTLKWTTQVK